ncbi:MAG: pilin [Patescibacteria group bacterium]
MKKFFPITLLLSVVLSSLVPMVVLAQQGGILPAVPGEVESCPDYMEAFYSLSRSDQLDLLKTDQEQVLGCAIKTGRIKLWLVPFFVTRLISFLIAIAGAISMLFIVIGGYNYVLGGLTDDKESGKKTLTYAIIGLVVALSAWIIVNVVQYQVTQ